MSTPEPRLIADYACRIGENPLWHPFEKRLYWTDIPSGRLFCYDPAADRHWPCYEGRPVGGFTIQADGALLLFMDRGTVATWRDGAFENTIHEEIADERETRFNDVIADPAGRVFCGTMPTPERKGRLYRLEKDGSLSIVLEGVGTSNGMGFTPDGTRFFHTDTKTRTITCYDYDRATGAITNPRPFIRVPDDPEEGGPDGMTVDAEGGVFSARFRGRCVARYSPDGELREKIPVPANNVTSVIFAGENLDELYITTAGGDDKATHGELAGGLFALDPGVQGMAECFSRIEVP